MVDNPKKNGAESDLKSDDGHFNQYGMRSDPRDMPLPNTENAGTGDNARRFGGGGDPATYENRDAAARRTQDPHGPIAQVSAGGSARALGFGYGGESHKDEALSSRQGAELINEKRNDAAAEKPGRK